MTKSWLIFKSNNSLGLNDILTISLVTFLFVTLMCLLNRTKNAKKLMIPRGSCHMWTFNDLFLKPVYCNLCSFAFMSGFHCDSCDIYVDIKCVKKSDKYFSCKETISSSVQSHKWIKGNLPLDSCCLICTKACGILPKLYDFKCVLCWRYVHEECLNVKLKEEPCDLGQFAQFILKASMLEAVNSSGKITLDKTALKNNETSLASPLVVFANTKSGGNDAVFVMRNLRAILNDLQIIDMNLLNSQKILEWLSLYSASCKFRILICGGDGTIGYLLDAISKLEFKQQLVFSVLPLGTGNDLSRTLGWGGGGDTNNIDVFELLHQIEHKSTQTKLDRWKITIKSKEKKYALRSLANDSSQKIKYMNNYFSIGCDALVTLNFHLRRQSLPISSRLVNKFMYFKYGTKDTFMKECRYLSQNIELELDGRIIELPHLESIVLLNIPYWGAGVKVWGERDDAPVQRIDDGFIEILGIYSSFHIAQLQVNLSEPYRMGQAKHVRIVTRKKYPMQIDGEPWNADACEIVVTYHNSITFLKKTS